MLSVEAPDGVPEVRRGDDLGGAAPPAGRPRRRRRRRGDQQGGEQGRGPGGAGDARDALAGETVRVVARRGSTSIVRTRHGLTSGGGGRSTPPTSRADRSCCCPRTPTLSARRIRHGIRAASGINVGVVVTDTAGRAWREGQTDIAIGAAGLLVIEDYAGRHDAHGNELAVTAPAVADEIAGRPSWRRASSAAGPSRWYAVGPTSCWPPETTAPGRLPWSGPSAGTCSGTAPARPCSPHCRPTRRPSPLRCRRSAEELVAALAVLGLARRSTGRDRDLPAHGLEAVTAVAFAHGWRVDVPDSPAEVRLRPAGP